MYASNVSTIDVFMTQLSQVAGFPYSYEDLQRFAEQIPATSGYKFTKSHTKSRPKKVGYGAVEKGKAHKVGTENEKSSLLYFNSNPDSPINRHLAGEKSFTWEHVGGTGTKIDGKCQVEDEGDKNCSFKKHKNKTGTFDWINGGMNNVPFAQDLKKKLLQFKSKYKNITQQQFNTNKPNLECELAELFSQHIDTIKSNDIQTILYDKIYKMYPEYTIINDCKNKRYILFQSHINLEKIFDKKNNHKFILKSMSAKTSRQIWIKQENGEEINTNLRIRLNTNNGISALLGFGVGNKSSSICIKIQQDNVEKFIEELRDPIIENY